jgi:hypothetical protein
VNHVISVLERKNTRGKTMTEFIYNEVQPVALNQAAVLNNSIECRKGYVIHENGSGLIILRGITTQCFARYQVTFNGNVAIPEGGTVAPIAVALTVNNEIRPTSRAIYTPAAVDEYGNVTCTAIVTVPRGCCTSVSLQNVPASEDPAVTPAPVISLQNANLVITRIAERRRDARYI